MNLISSITEELQQQEGPLSHGLYISVPPMLAETYMPLRIDKAGSGTCTWTQCGGNYWDGFPTQLQRPTDGEGTSQ
jgi:hypothetical protein